ncbi:MAG: threonine transporter RhtB, partial [SAR86 cluster bacterium]
FFCKNRKESMPPLNDILLFTAAAFIMNLSPGPSNFYVMARTIARGTSAGLAAVAGLAAGSLLHVIAAVLGLSALFTYSPLAFTLLKIAGASYLVYLGLGYFQIRVFSKNDEQSSDCERAKQEELVNLGMKKIFVQSVIIEVSNPKTALFYLALLPQFVVPEAGPAAPQFLLLGLIVTLSAIPCDLFVIFFADKTASLIRGNQKFRDKLDKISGTILITLGAYVLLAESD